MMMTTMMIMHDDSKRIMKCCDKRLLIQHERALRIV